MGDESLRRRLEALNRGPMPGPVGEAARASARVYAGLLTEQRPKVAENTVARLSSTRRTQPIPGLMRQGEVVETPSGEHLRVRLPLETLWPEGPRLVAARQRRLQQQLAIAQQAVEPAVVIDPEFAAFVGALPNHTLLLDLETCGLAGAALFLVGLLRQIDGRPAIELLVARNYAEEAAVLASLWQRVAQHDVLVTFNGKSFDWPMVLERSVRHRLHGTSPDGRLVHVDVLHHARRRFRGHLPDCRLQTLERFVCRREREADIPGHLIPGVYADFVRTGYEREMDMVLYHNAVDLVTLLDLALRLAG